MYCALLRAARPTRNCKPPVKNLNTLCILFSPGTPVPNMLTMPLKTLPIPKLAILYVNFTSDATTLNTVLIASPFFCIHVRPPNIANAPNKVPKKPPILASIFLKGDSISLPLFFCISSFSLESFFANFAESSRFCLNFALFSCTINRAASNFFSLFFAASYALSLPFVSIIKLF